MIVLGLATLGFALACLPAILFFQNLRIFARLPALSPGPTSTQSISLLIPARNESASIAAAVESARSSIGIDFEIIVLDDGSTDDTASIVKRIAETDTRVQLVTAPPLPEGWCGKQHACHVLATLARHDLLAWIDADVRLEPDALARISHEMRDGRTSLLSGFPIEETISLGEQLLIPLIHFLLLGFLPLARSRRSRQPSLGAGCGQLFIARRDDYFRCGGHSSIRASLHDGIMLPRVFRRAGMSTDLFDATDLARCRMYDSLASTWHGLLKNAGEGMASPAAIVPWTLILAGGQLLPPILAILITMIAHLHPLNETGRLALAMSIAGFALSLIVRFTVAFRFRQPKAVVLLHPVAIYALLAIQWQSLIMRCLGRSTTWRGRKYVPGGGAS